MSAKVESFTVESFLKGRYLKFEARHTFSFTVRGEIDLKESKEALKKYNEDWINENDSEALFEELDIHLDVLVWATDIEKLMRTLPEDIKFGMVGLVFRSGCGLDFEPPLNIPRSEQLKILRTVRNYCLKKEKETFEQLKDGSYAESYLWFNTDKLMLEMVKSIPSSIDKFKYNKTQEMKLTAVLERAIPYDPYETSEVNEISNRLKDPAICSNYRLCRYQIVKNYIQKQHSPYHVLEDICDY